MLPKILHQDIFLAIGLGIIGAVAGFGIGSYGGSPFEGWLWMGLMGVSGCYLTLAHRNSSRKISIIVLFHGFHIAFFTMIGAIITWTNVDPFGLPFGLRFGVLLSTMLGIYAEKTQYEIPGGFFVLLDILTGGGAGGGALVGFLFGYDAGLCAVFGLLMAGLIPYYFLLLRVRLVFFTFIILTALGLQVGYFLFWSLLQCFYWATITSLSIGLVFSTLDYFCIYCLKKSPFFGTLHLL